MPANKNNGVWEISGDNGVDGFDKLLVREVRAVEERRQALIAGLLKQKDRAIWDFDEKLGKLGHRPNAEKK